VGGGGVGGGDKEHANFKQIVSVPPRGEVILWDYKSKLKEYPEDISVSKLG
jgi:hypothetical protein